MKKAKVEFWIEVLAGEMAVIVNTLFLIVIWKIFGLIPALLYFGSDLLLGIKKIERVVAKRLMAEAEIKEE